MTGQRQIVDAPSYSPTPFGLMTTVEWVTSSDPHWQNGITYSPMCGAGSLGATTFDECIAVTGTGDAPPPQAFANTVTHTPRGATSFVAMTEFDCAPIGNDQAQKIATDALAMAEPWQVERAFWTGVASGQSVVFPHLAANAQTLDATGILLQSAATTVTGVGETAPHNIDLALGLLEEALGNCYGGIGVIHVPELLLPTMDAWGVIKKVGAVMYTTNGNKIAVGGGYPGTSPAGVARGSSATWIYATGNVFGYRSQVRVRAPQGAQAFDRSTNTMKMIAERTYVLGWDCCHFAIQSNVGVPKGT
jgi:hypothetical protein